MNRYLYLICAALITFSSTASAHDKSLHVGKPTHGTLSHLSQNKFDLDTGKEIVPVTLEPNVKVEDQDGKPLSSIALKDGQMVMVYGTKLETGVLVSSSIMIHSNMNPSAQGSSKPAACGDNMPCGGEHADAGESSHEHQMH